MYPEPTSHLYAISDNGSIQETAEQINYSYASAYSDTKTIPPQGNVMVNISKNAVYSSDHFEVFATFGEPVFPTGLSRNGKVICGSNNNPEWFPNKESAHEKVAKIYNWQTKTLSSISTQGYPMLIFESNRKGIISLSAGMKLDKLSTGVPKPDLFFERIK
ncbi:hypothetical protein [Zunongwangia endophytica]|uniref:Uncharacterized protein n=1 Tax=Zunongwangia endophytica TaxID=1808945 RepID=A0ABV8HCL4_9FLAO|nr:hypothetical protein [Zunongwangia endophytica]MDN3594377.1 hypothetical protein [Zunongwangia endophytica]